MFGNTKSVRGFACARFVPRCLQIRADFSVLADDDGPWGRPYFWIPLCFFELALSRLVSPHGTYCRDGPPWPPSIEYRHSRNRQSHVLANTIQTEGGHGGPAQQYVQYRLTYRTRWPLEGLRSRSTSDPEASRLVDHRRPRTYIAARTSCLDRSGSGPFAMARS